MEPKRVQMISSGNVKMNKHIGGAQCFIICLCGDVTIRGKATMTYVIVKDFNCPLSLVLD